MHQVSCDACSRSTQRMTDSDGASVDVGFFRVEAQHFLDSQILRCKCLVHLKQQRNNKIVCIRSTGHLYEGSVPAKNISNLTVHLKSSYLYQIHVLQGQPCFLQNLSNGRHRAYLENQVHS